MAQLDPLLQTLVDKDAQELLLIEGQRPVFRVGGELRPVSQKSLDRAQVTALLSELAGKVEAASLAQGRPTRFVYTSPRGNPFVCQTDQDNGTLRARVAPQPSSNPAAQEGPAPAAAPSPPPAVAESAPTERAEAGAAVATGAPNEIDRYLRHMLELEASDLHLSAGQVPVYRVHGDMQPMDGEPALPDARVRELLRAIMPENNLREYEETHDTDFAYEIAGVARFRANVFTDRTGCGGVLRIIPSEILTAEQLGLPPAILTLCQLHRGLVLVTGPTGSGKSTTLAAMIDAINRTRSDHIITIEDPIEFVHPNRKCLVNQRQVESHTASFKRALRAALREDPDIILLGEIRDLETMAIAIETAETGHLVFGTLHTTTACSTIDRVIDQFPADRQAQIRTMLSESLKGVVAQNLLRKIGGGRVAAMEILIVTLAISNMIREGKTFQLPSLMQTGKKHGMVLLNDCLLKLVKDKLVEPGEAYSKANDKGGLATQFRASGIPFDCDVEI